MSISSPQTLGAGPAWFLAQVKPNCEAVAERNLKRQGFQIFLPREDVTRELRGRFVTRRRPVFPGYIFVAFDPAAGLWRSINGTYGVARLVSFGPDPAPVPAGLVPELMGRTNEEGVLAATESFKAGDQVVVSQGPFSNLVAQVVENAPERRVWVLLDIMGADRRIMLEMEQLRPK